MPTVIDMLFIFINNILKLSFEFVNSLVNLIKYMISQTSPYFSVRKPSFFINAYIQYKAT